MSSKGKQKLRWSQTPEGREHLRKAQQAVWAKRKAATGSADTAQEAIAPPVADAAPAPRPLRVHILTDTAISTYEASSLGGFFDLMHEHLMLSTDIHEIIVRMRY